MATHESGEGTVHVSCGATTHMNDPQNGVSDGMCAMAGKLAAPAGTA